MGRWVWAGFRWTVNNRPDPDDTINATCLFVPELEVFDSVGRGVAVQDPLFAHQSRVITPAVFDEVGKLVGRAGLRGRDHGLNVKRVAHVDHLERAGGQREDGTANGRGVWA